MLLRRYRVLFDPPPPAAMADDVETALARLAPAGRADRGRRRRRPQRYLWTEELELRRVEVDIHPGRPDPRGYVITRATVPIRLGYAAAKLDGAPLYRVLVPRFDWSFVTEDLETVPDTMRALVFAALIGDSPASLYDLRREVDEQIVEWRPIEAPLRGRTKAADEQRRRRRRSRRSPRTGSRSRARAGCRRPSASIRSTTSSRRCSTTSELPSLLLVGPRGAGKTALVRRLARGLLERSRGKAGRRRRLWATSADRIVAGMVYLGMWQQRCLADRPRARRTATTCCTSIASPT